MTTSIFSKLSQQSKHRDLLENPDPDAPPIGNPKTGKTIAEFRAMGLDVRMACGACRTRGPLDLTPLPKGADTESRLVAARCPRCGSEAVSQEIVAVGTVEGPLFTAFLRTPRVAPPKSYGRNRPARPELLPEDDLPADLLPTIEKKIVEDHDAEEAEVETRPAGKAKAPAKAAGQPAPKAPAKPAAKATAAPPPKAPDKAAGKPAAKASATAPVKATAKTSAKPAPKAPAKPVAKTAPKAAAKAAGKTPAKSAAKPSVKASATVASKAAPKAPAKTSAKPVTKAPAKAAAKPVTKAPAKASATPAMKTPAKSPAKPATKTPAKAAPKAGAKASGKPASKAAAKAPKPKGGRG